MGTKCNGALGVPGDKSQLPWKGHWSIPGLRGSASAKDTPRTRGLEGPVVGTKGAGACLGEHIWLMWPESHVGVTGRKTRQKYTAHNAPAPRHPHIKLSKKGSMKMASKTVRSLFHENLQLNTNVVFT